MKLMQKQNRNSGITAATTPGQRVPLSFSQEILWLATVLQSESIYNEFFALKLTGHLDPESLKSALKELVRRHWTLRTHIELHESTPVQIVAETADFEWRDYVLSGLSPEEQTREVDKRAREARLRPFELARDFMLRAELIQFAGQEHTLLLTTHHISCDGWSHGIFLYELMALYDAFAQGRPSPLTEMPIQYSDFAVWQRERMQGGVLEKHLKYWRGQLGGMEPLELPSDFLRTSSRGPTGASEFLCIAPDLTSQLRELCRRERVSLFMALATALQIVLGRWAGQTDVAIGTPVANRPSGCESLIGYFVNQLVLRTDLAGNPTIRELLGRVRTTCLNGYAHQDLPFEKLVNDLNLAQDMQAESLLRVVFAFTEELQFEASGNGLTVRLKMMPVEAQPFARFDLLLSLNGVNNELQGGLVYNTALFEAATIRRVLRTWSACCRQWFPVRISGWVSCPLISAEERRQLLIAGNTSPVVHRPAKCLHQLFEEQVGRTPDAVAVTYERQALSYAELNQQANRLARYLRMVGIGPEEGGLCLNRSLEMVIAVLATLKAGGSYVPMDPAYPQERLAYMLADAEVKVLLTEAEFTSRFSGDACHVINLDWIGKLQLPRTVLKISAVTPLLGKRRLHYLYLRIHGQTERRGGDPPQRYGTDGGYRSRVRIWASRCVDLVSFLCI